MGKSTITDNRGENPKKKKSILKKELFDSEVGYRRLFESAKDGILIIDAETGKIIDANPFLCNLLEYSKEKFIDKELWQIGFFNDITANKEKKLELQKEEYVRYEDLPIETATGRMINVEFVSSVYFVNECKVIQCNIRDITERKKVEELLQETEERYKSFFENSIDAILITNSDGRILSANPAACKMFGYSEEEFIELRRYGLADMTDPRITDLISKRSLNKKAHGEVTFIRKDGVRFPGETSSAVFKNRNGLEYTSLIIRDITERKMANEKLLASKLFIEEIINSIPVRVFWKDKDLVYLGCNTNFAGDAGFSNPREIIGKDDYQMGWRDRAELYRNDDRNVIETGRSKLLIEEPLTTPEGKTITLLTNKIPLRDSKGEITGLLGTYIDITERKQVEEKIREKDIQFRKLSEQVHDLIFQFTRRPDGTYFVPIASEGIKNIFGCSPEDVIEDFTPIAKVIFPDDFTRVISDIEYSAKHLSLFTCDFRVQIPGKSIQWIHSNSKPEKLSDGSITWYGFNSDVTERKLAEEKLKESEERFRTAAETITDVVYEWDIKQKLDWYGDIDGIMGYPPGGFPRTIEGWAATVHPKDKDRVMAALEDHLKGGATYAIEYRVRRKDGEWRWWSARGTALRNKRGEPYRMIGSITDISEQKRINENLLESEKKFRTVVEEAVEIVFTVDNRGYFTYINPAGLKSSGYSLDELKKFRYIDLIEPEFKQKVKRHYFKQYLERSSLSTTEYPFRTKTGKINWFNTNSRLIIENNEVKGFYVIARNVTERRIAEEALKGSEQRFRAIFDQAPIAIAMLDFQGHPVLSNSRLSKMLGYTRDELSKMMFTEFTYPEDIDMDLNQFTDLINGKISGYNMEKRYIHKNGNLIWANLYVTTLNENNGSPNEIIGMVEDITDRKLIAKALQESNERFKALHNASFGGIAIHDKGIILECNQGLSDMTGYSPEELKGMNGLLLIAPEHREMVMNNIVTGNEKPYEANGLRKNGEQFPIRLEARNIPYKGKNVRTVEFRNLTESKQVEEELLKAKAKAEESEEKYKLLHENAGVGIGYYNTEGKVISFNQLAAKNMNGNPEDFIGKSIFDLSPKPAADLYFNRIQKAIHATEPAVYEDKVQLPNEEKWFLSAFTKIANSHNKVFGVQIISQDITTLKTTEIELQKSKVKAEESEEKHKEKHNLLSNFIKHSPIYSFIKLVEPNLSKVVYASDNYVDMTGINASEMIDKTMYELFPHELAKKITFDDWEVINNGKILALDEDLNDKNYTTIKFPIVSQNKKFLAGFTIDITERKKNEFELIKAKEKAEESEQRFRSLIENAPDGVVILNESGKFIYVSPNAARLFGYSLNEAIVHFGYEYTHPDDLPLVLKTIETIVNNPLQKPIVNYRFRRKNGEYRWIETTFTNLLSDKVINGIILNFTDVTERRQILEDIVTAKDKAEESDRLKSAFLANMSHEIRTPMNGILGFTNLLLEPDLSSEEKESYINVVQQSGQRMLNTVNDIMEISKIEAGIVTNDIKEIDVQVRLDELIQFFTPEATKKGLKLILENEVPKTVSVISTDQNKIDSIFTNLIKNAIKYTPSGEIRVGCMLKENILEYYVKDTGIGIPAERQQAVFNRFEQVDIKDNRVFEGSGLGLAIAKSYVEMLGGKIWVESREEKGSIFFFTLPLNGQAQGKIQEKETGKQDDKTSPIKGMNIIIAEDDKTSALYLQTILKKGNHRVLLTHNGQEVTEACYNNPDVDLVLMDIQMPGMNGYDATRRIREFNKDVIIIAQTAYALSGDREKAMNAGCNDYIAKPIYNGVLLEKIQKYFSV